MAASISDRRFGLDLLRAFAIIGVLCLHVTLFARGLPAAARQLFEFGWVGVDLFFVLSGFLISDQTRSLFVRESCSTGQRALRFWVRRWTRTLPLYFVVLFVYALVKPALFHAPFVGFSWKYFFFLQNTGPILDFVQSWSLCIEEQFYLVFPLVFFFLKPGHPALWLLPFALSIGLRGYEAYVSDTVTALQGGLSAAEFDRRFRFSFFHHLDGIALGVFLGMTREKWEALAARKRPIFFAAGSGLVLLACGLFGPNAGGLGAVFYFTLLSLGFGAFLVGAYGVRSAPRGLGWITWLAIWSYGAYLWNNLFIRVLDRYWAGHWSLGMALFLLGTLALSAATYQWVEKPGLKLRKILLNS